MIDYIVYGRTDPACSYCEQAKALLDAHGLLYRFNDITGDPAMLARVKAICADHGVPATVPQIIKVHADAAESYVGGFEHLKAALERV